LLIAPGTSQVALFAHGQFPRAHLNKTGPVADCALNRQLDAAMHGASPRPERNGSDPKNASLPARDARG
jgi:hypothetical protein